MTTPIDGRVLRAFIEPKVRPIDIAREAGCSRAYVSQVLSGHARPSARFLDACRRLDIPVDQLYPDAPVAA